MAEARQIVGDVFSALGAAGNIVLFLSQIPLMRRLIREGDATKYSFLPSLTMLATMSLWSCYTVFVIPVAQLLAANFAGVAIPLGYLVVFVIYTPTWAGRLRILGLAFAVLAVAWGVSLAIFLAKVPDAGNIVGWITACVNVSFFTSPLKRLVEAVRERDVSRVPTTLTYVQLVQPLVWIIAAAMLNDNFILGVNALGLAFAWTQFGVLLYLTCVSGVKPQPVEDTAQLASNSVAIDVAADDAKAIVTPPDSDVRSEDSVAEASTVECVTVDVDKIPSELSEGEAEHADMPQVAS